MFDASYIKYADDLSVLTFTREKTDPSIDAERNHIEQWCREHKMFINEQKTTLLSFSTKKKVSEENNFTNQTAVLLGVVISNNMKWDNHVENAVRKCNKKLYHIFELKRCGVGTRVLWRAYEAFIRPTLTYCYAAMCNMPTFLLNKLIRIETKVKKIIGSQPKHSLKDILEMQCKKLAAAITSSSDHSLRSLVHYKTNSYHCLRKQSYLVAPFARTNRFKDSLIKYF